MARAPAPPRRGRGSGRGRLTRRRQEPDDAPRLGRRGGLGAADRTIRGVYGAALGTYRRRFGAIALAGVLIFVPVGLLLLPVRSLVERFADARVTAGLALVATGAGAGIVASLIGITIFAGVIEALVAADQEGVETPVLEVLRRLPLVRLIMGAALVAVLVLVGVALFIVPGIVILFLLGIVGPLIAIERLGIWSALRRSATLAWRHPLLVTFTVTIPLLLEDVPVRLLERITWLEALPASVMLDVLSSIFLGGLVGVLEVTLARALLAEDRRRRAPDEREPAAGRRGRTGTKAVG